MLLAVWTAGGATDEEFRVYGDHPRLFLTAHRLRLLRRERERQSIRWQQFDALISGKAAMPETGFADALYSEISGDPAYCRQAVNWALRPTTTDLHQMALVLDWCQPEAAALAPKIRQAMEQTAGAADVATVRSATLAAIALAGDGTGRPEAVLESIVRQWWRGRIVPALKQGSAAVPRDQMYALVELLHAIGSNLNIDLREDLPEWFAQLPALRILNYYPAPYPAPENRYRIPAYTAEGDPDLRAAALARAADLGFVAFESNSREAAFLQGWLMHDEFLMRSPFGIPYEFLWANPYQPGLSYYHIPLTAHDQFSGQFFARSDWDDDAEWFGRLDSGFQLFADGKRKTLQRIEGPVHIGDTTIVAGRAPLRFVAGSDADSAVFLIGLTPKRAYQIEIDREEVTEMETDGAGILKLALPKGKSVGVWIREAPKAESQRGR